MAVGQLASQTKMSYSPPVNITVLLSLVIFVFYFLGLHNLLTSYRKNDCEMTFMFQYPQFVEISLPAEVQKSYPKYALYGYGEGGITEQLRKMKFKGIPVLFVPGSSGSHKQGRSLASVSLRKSLNSRTPFHFNYFMIDFNEEQAAFFGGVLQDQTEFVTHCIKKILNLYQNNDESRKPTSVILIGHSLGGIILKGIFMNPDFDPQLVQLIISLAAPHKYPIIQPDYYITSYYKNMENFWKNNTDLQHINMISIGGGFKDIVVGSDVTYDNYSDLNVLTTAIPGVWLPNDHFSIMWCKQLILTVIRALFDSVDISTKQLSSNKEYIDSVFRYHFLKRSAGKRYSTSLTSRFSTFERSANWIEHLQRQFSVTEPRGVKSNHYIMIRLFSDPKSEAAFIEGYNVNVRDWIFVCSADVVHNSIRMCETGENLSNLTEIAPVDFSLKLKRKFVYLNLLELKAKSFTHVLVRLPPADYHMSVNIDVHQPTDRNIDYQVPKFYSLSSETVIPNTQPNAGYYTVRLVGFEYVWQSYIMTLQVLSCKATKNNAVVSFIVPWANVDEHFIFRDKDSLEVNLSLITPKPKNHPANSHPFVRFHLDPTCSYRVTVKPFLIGMFTQGARFYSLMLPAFLGAVAVLTVRQQMKFLDDGKCVLFQSALSAAVRRYYLILQATVLGSKILGVGFCLMFLPTPDFSTLQELNLDSFFMTILLYGVAVIVMYLLGAVIYVTIVLSAQATHKLALRFVAKSISGVFNWSEWILSALQQAPFFLTVLLISLSLSTCGALALWTGVIFYFIKLCAMYEEYLEDWFKYSIKIIAKKVKDVISNKPKPSDNAVTNEGSDNGAVTSSAEQELPKTEPDTSSSQNLAEEADEKSSGVDLLSAIHFHISVFLVWLLIALINLPSLLMWTKNYHHNMSLEKDPAVVLGIVVSACGAVLWQPEVPTTCKKISQVTSSVLFLLAVAGLMYASLSLYRLGYILCASLVVLSLNQIYAKYIQ